MLLRQTHLACDLPLIQLTQRGIHNSPSSGNASKVNTSSGTISKPSSSGVKKSQSDSSISQPVVTNISKQNSTPEQTSNATGNGENAKVSQKDVRNHTGELDIGLKMEPNPKTPNFPYKPASAGKPPLVEIVTSQTPRILKSKCVDSEVIVPVQTPLIVNPFENYLQPQDQAQEIGKQANSKKGNQKGVTATSYGFVVSKPQIERSKTNVSVKSQGKVGKRGKDGKPSSANAKLAGGKRKGAKSKEGKGSDEGAVPRPKSGKKRVRSGKRRKKTPTEIALSKQAAQADVALISGIGWHLATKCIDTSDVIAVKTRGSNSSDSELDSDEDMDNATPRPQRMLTDEDLQLLASQDFQFPINLELEGPDNVNIPSEYQLPGSSNKYMYLQVDNKNLTEAMGSNQSTPRFKQVKRTEQTGNLPKIDFDGYRPMNLDMTQSSMPLESVHQRSENVLKNSLPADLSGMFLKMDVNGEDEDFSNPELDETTAELHRQILLGKLTPIPESPSLKSSVPLHKTLEALQNFDRNVKDETLDNLLGIEAGELPDTSRSDYGKKLSAKKSSPKDAGRMKKVSASTDAKKNSSSKKDKITSAKDTTAGKFDGAIDSKEAVRLSIENIRAAIEKSKKANAVKPINQMKKSASDSKLSKGSVDFVPKLDLSQVDDGGKFIVESNRGKGQSTRRERKFSETKSDEKFEEDAENNLDEAIEDIMSNTFNSTSTLRSNKSLHTGSRSNTLTDADRSLIMKMAANTDSPFHAKPNISVSACESSRKRHHSDSDDFSAQQSTNPNLLKVFQAGDFKLGQKVKAMMDAGADKAKIRTMINVDNEAKQLAKIMNSFRNMELYAGPGGSYKYSSKRPEVSHGEPSSSKKPPINRPGSGGPVGKARSAGRFTEIRGSKAEDGTSIRTSAQKVQVSFSKMLKSLCPSIFLSLYKFCLQLRNL